MAKIKLTAQETVATWNIISNLIELTDNPHFTSWAKRLFAYLRPEIKIWNDLSIKEREAIIDTELSYPVDKLKAEHLPDIVQEEQKEILSKLCEGEISFYESQLSKALKG